MARLWFKIDAWHVTDDEATSLCGRAVPDAAPLALTYPYNEATCETCLRLVAKEAGDAAQEGVIEEGDLAEHQDGDEGGPTPEAGGGHRDAQGGQVEEEVGDDRFARPPIDTPQ